MIKAIKDWLKGQFIFFLRGAPPSIRHNICIICRNLATRKIAMNAIWSFVVIVGLCILLRKKR